MSTPIRILAVDVGTGTQDILLFESGKTPISKKLDRFTMIGVLAVYGIVNVIAFT